MKKSLIKDSLSHNTMAKDLYSDDNIITQNWARWDKIGKSYEGVYVDREKKPNNLKGDGSMQTIYTLVQEDGSILKLGGPGGRDLGQFNAIKLGTYVGVKYINDIEPKKAGYNPSKQVTVFSAGEERPEVLEQYQRDQGVFQPNNENEENEIPEM